MQEGSSVSDFRFTRSETCPKSPKRLTGQANGTDVANVDDSPMTEACCAEIYLVLRWLSQVFPSRGSWQERDLTSFNIDNEEGRRGCQKSANARTSSFSTDRRKFSYGN